MTQTRAISVKLLRAAFDGLVPMGDWVVGDEETVDVSLDFVRMLRNEIRSAIDDPDIGILAQLNLWLDGERYCPECNGSRYTDVISEVADGVEIVRYVPCTRCRTGNGAPTGVVPLEALDSRD